MNTFPVADDHALVATLDRIGALGVIAIVRAPSPEDATATGLRLIDAGLDVIEVSFTTPDAAAVIEGLRASRPDALVGAGTVLTEREAGLAVKVGAGFLLSPAYGEAVDAVARGLDVPYIPGVITATDVWRCLERGLEVLKLFPAATLGPSGMQALLEPFPQVRPIPTGGVSVQSAGDWARVGAFALGMGGSLSRTDDPGAAAAALRAALHGA